MAIDTVNPESRTFLETLFSRTGGNTAAQVSMFDIGAEIGMDRDASSAAAQELMGVGLVEIRTLSGGIAMSKEGVSVFDAGSKTAPGPTLGADPFLDEPCIEAVRQAAARIRSAIADLGIPFDALADLVADLRTIEAQLASSKPKTGVVRACLESAGRLGSTLPKNGWETAVEQLLGKPR